MAAERRIVSPAAIGHALCVSASTDPRRTCRKTIVLDGARYRCGRETYDGQHDGIHDAFAVHSDLGEVRW